MQASTRPDDLLPSVLDRLLDDAPHQARGPAPTPPGLGELKATLARDLEVLLNTRALPAEWPVAYRLASRSVVAFGTPELSGLSLLSADDREVLRARVQNAISIHEPRLAQPRVTLELAHGNDRVLRFHVDAVLRAARYRAPISFDATLEVASNAYQVSR